MKSSYHKIIKDAGSGSPRLAILIDPDKFNEELIPLANKSRVSYFFVGGSKITSGNFERTIRSIKKKSKLPVIIFPGDVSQISSNADAILFLSLISGRNPDFLIDAQIRSAPVIRKKNLESISTGYILIDGGTISTTQKVSRTIPIASGNTKLAVDTAIAGEMLGMKMIYLEAGSGAKKNVPVRLISKVKKNISIPLIVGGGITSAKRASQVIESGADIVVVGNALEKDPSLLHELKNLF